MATRYQEMLELKTRLQKLTRAELEAKARNLGCYFNPKLNRKSLIEIVMTRS